MPATGGDPLSLPWPCRSCGYRAFRLSSTLPVEHKVGAGTVTELVCLSCWGMLLSASLMPGKREREERMT